VTSTFRSDVSNSTEALFFCMSDQVFTGETEAGSQFPRSSGWEAAMGGMQLKKNMKTYVTSCQLSERE
jgi:hypothetical protein